MSPSTILLGGPPPTKTDVHDVLRGPLPCRLHFKLTHIGIMLVQLMAHPRLRRPPSGILGGAPRPQRQQRQAPPACQCARVIFFWMICMAAGTACARGCGSTWVMYCLGVSVAVVVPRCSTTVGRLSMLRQPDRTNQLFCSGEYCRPLIPCSKPESEQMSKPVPRDKQKGVSQAAF